jgi:hypothetical protein
MAKMRRSLQNTEQKFCRWKKKHGSLGTSKIREQRQPGEKFKS